MPHEDREQQGATRATPDLDALLCGLVLAPDTWSRNRFYRLYEDPRARRVRRRAQQVRSVIALLRRVGGDLTRVLPEVDDAAGDVVVVIDAPQLNLVRRSRLAPLELALVRYALHVGDAAAAMADRVRVEQALGRLMRAPS